LIYLDTSAFLKLVKPEPETAAFEAFVDGRADFVASARLAVEARRGALRRAPRSLPRVDLLLRDVELVAMSPAIVESASRLPDPLLRSLDAIHLATAILLRSDLELFVTYDSRLADAAAAYGIPTAGPA
jgi:predicted nucleic acid-binding protein